MLRHNKNSVIINTLSIIILLSCLLIRIAAFNIFHNWSPDFNSSDMEAARSFWSPIFFASGFTIIVCLIHVFILIRKNTRIRSLVSQNRARPFTAIQIKKHNTPLFVVTIIFSILPAVLTTAMSVAYIVNFFWRLLNGYTVF